MHVYHTHTQAMILIIILNVAVMCMVHANMTETWQAALSATNVVFTAIFVMEMGAKWIAVSQSVGGWGNVDLVALLYSQPCGDSM
jgi:hypothetical protein